MLVDKLADLDFLSCAFPLAGNEQTTFNLFDYRGGCAFGESLRQAVRCRPVQSEFRKRCLIEKSLSKPQEDVTLRIGRLHHGAPPKTDSIDYARLHQRGHHSCAGERGFSRSRGAQHEQKPTRIILVDLRLSKALQRGTNRTRPPEKDRRVLELEGLQTAKW
jgi:hypothetical protein